jgi:hypothetical protein
MAFEGEGLWVLSCFGSQGWLAIVWCGSSNQQKKQREAAVTTGKCVMTSTTMAAIPQQQGSSGRVGFWFGDTKLQIMPAMVE